MLLPAPLGSVVFLYFLKLVMQSRHILFWNARSDHHCLVSSHYPRELFRNSIDLLFHGLAPFSHEIFPCCGNCLSQLSLGNHMGGETHLLLTSIIPPSVSMDPLMLSLCNRFSMSSCLLLAGNGDARNNTCNTSFALLQLWLSLFYASASP